MSLYIIESRDSFDNSDLIFGVTTPLFGWNTTRLFAGTLDTYIVGLHGFSSKITRITTSDRLYTKTSVDPPGGDSHSVMTHIIGDFNTTLYGVSVDIDNPPFAIHVASYPESSGNWTTFSGVNHAAIDIEFPEFLESPRFLIAFGSNVSEKILVVEVVSGLDISGRHATIWNSPLDSEAVITDLEVASII